MKDARRFKNSIRNSSVALFGQVFNIVFGFLLRSIFIHRLGQEYLGVNGVMESMLTLLSMTELGIGTSVAFALYRPVNDDDKQHIGRLMAFYRKTYHAIGIVTLIAGLLLMPFMNFFTKDVSEVSNIAIIYLLFLSNTVLSYFFAYKTTLLSAYQDYYVISAAESVSCFIKYILQAAVLIVFESYIGYILVNMVCVLGANVAVSLICDKRYGYVKEYRKEKLEKEDKELLKTSVVSLIYQKIGAKLVMGTDNLMISYVSIAVMGVYSNYTMIVSTVTRIVRNVSHAVMGSVGNLLVQNDKEHKYKVYEEIVFCEFCFYFMIAVGMAGCMERFIVWWAGDNWLLPQSITFIVIMNFFIMGMRQPNVMVIEAAGLFNKMRAKAVAEVVVNLVVSLLFLVVLEMGIYGVLLGTTISMVSVCIWWEAGAVHKYAFEKSLKGYWYNYISYLAVAAAGCFGAYYICGKIPLGGIGGIALSGVTSVIIGGGLIFAVYGKTKRFRRILGRVIKRGEKN